MFAERLCGNSCGLVQTLEAHVEDMSRLRTNLRNTVRKRCNSKLQNVSTLQTCFPQRFALSFHRCFREFYRKHDTCFHNIFRKFLRRHDMCFRKILGKFLHKHDICFHNVFCKFLPQTRQSFHKCFHNLFSANTCPIGTKICGKPQWSGSESFGNACIFRTKSGGKTCPRRTQICGISCSVQTPALWKTALRNTTCKKTSTSLSYKGS